jgi:hypothetical protein
LALQGAQVIEPRLDLDDEQRACSLIECEDVDPAMRPAMHDLDLARR